MKKTVLLAAAALLLCAPCAGTFREGGQCGCALAGSAWGGEGWKAEFEEVCGKTDDSMTMTRDELKALIARCDKLKPLIEAQEETVRKVYLRRLQMCRDLFAYVYDVKSRN